MTPLFRARTTLFRLVEGVRVLFRYKRSRFLFTDSLLWLQYAWQNPYRLSRCRPKWDGSLTYGETPLTTLDTIARECRLLSSDVVYDLGCGTGRTVFWLAAFVGCQAVGVECFSPFVQKANRVQRWGGIKGVSFLEGDMYTLDYSQATALYICSVCLNLDDLQPALSTLRKGTKVITVSAPLEVDHFHLEKTFTVPFPWGKSTVFLHTYG